MLQRTRAGGELRAHVQTSRCLLAQLPLLLRRSRCSLGSCTGSHCKWAAQHPPVQSPPCRLARHVVATALHEHISAASPSQPEELEALRASSGDGTSPTGDTQGTQYSIVNFYHLTNVEHPFKLLREHQKWVLGRDFAGRVYISAQGINAQYSAPTPDALAYAQWVAQQPGFEGLQWTAEGVEGHQFPKLRLKVRPALVQLAGGTRHLPITDPQARATPLSPSAWQAMLRDAVAPAGLAEHSSSSQAAAAAAAAAAEPAGSAVRGPPEVGADGNSTVASSSGGSPGVVVLDVRNAYEWDAGHFVGADRPLEDNFNETPTDASGSAGLPAQLRGAAPDTRVLMYCTGGIRCDIYSAYLRSQGFNQLYTLEKGIQNYLKQQGGDSDGLWKGSLFVFDARMAVPPGEAGEGAEGSLPAAAPCSLCGGAAQLPHVNCANIDCNALFLSCEACREKHRGCCCEACIAAPRLLRPSSSGSFGRWLEAATEGRQDGGGEASAAGSRAQDALRRQQAALARRIAEGRGEGRARRRASRKVRMVQRTAALRGEQQRRRRLVEEALEAQRQREETEATAEEDRLRADLAVRLAELRARRQQRELQEAC